MELKAFAFILIWLGIAIIAVIVAIPATEDLKAFRKFMILFNTNCPSNKITGRPLFVTKGKIKTLIILFGFLLLITSGIILIYINDIINFTIYDPLIGMLVMAPVFLLIIITLLIFYSYSKRIFIYQNAFVIKSIFWRKVIYFNKIDSIELKNIKIRGLIYCVYIMKLKDKKVIKLWLSSYKGLDKMEKFLTPENPYVIHIDKQTLSKPTSWVEYMDTEDRA